MLWVLRFTCLVIHRQVNDAVNNLSYIVSMVLKTLFPCLLRKWDRTATSYTGECNTQEHKYVPWCSKKDSNQWLQEFKQSKPCTFKVNSHSECAQGILSQTKMGHYKFTNGIKKKFCKSMLSETKLRKHITIPHELWNVGLMSE
jgi:hypothetical protein